MYNRINVGMVDVEQCDTLSEFVFVMSGLP